MTTNEHPHSEVTTPVSTLEEVSARASSAEDVRASRRPFARPKQPPALKNSMAGETDTSIHGGTTASQHSYSRPPESWGKGILSDFQTTVRVHWWSEMKNLNSKTVAVSFFLFIAVIAPSITFGAVYAKRTNNYMGAVELLLATAWCGIFYSLVAGMPMMINGGTGPVLTFQAVTYELSKNLDVPFLSFNAWIGLWVAFYMVLSGFFDLNRYILYATRFTDEIFAFLIISIFILDAIGNPASNVGLMHYFNPDHKHHSDQEADDVDGDYEYLTVAFLSLILGLGTCFLALILRGIRHSPFCCNDSFRSTVTDFAITLSVALFTLVKELLFPDVQTEELNVPSSFAPTFNCCDADCRSYFPDDCPEQEAAYGRRSWVVDLFDLNGKGWIIFVSAGPAALAFILAFLDNGITWHIINHPSNKLTHGEAYNYDTCISALMIATNSIIGLPWLVASTVPCMMHISAMTEKTKDGTVLSVQESRLTGLFTHVLVLASLMALSTIKLIPLPVLYGVFLFMGLVALPAQQFWQRILLFFMQPAKYPETPYTVFMENDRIHLYTLIQLGFFALLYMVKTIKTVAIAFPFFILLCIPARLYLLPRIFAPYELVVLDGSPEEVEEFLELVMEETENEAVKLLENGDSGSGKDSSDDQPGAAGSSDIPGSVSASKEEDDADSAVQAEEEDFGDFEEELVAVEGHIQPGALLAERLQPDERTPVSEIILNHADHFTPEMFNNAARRSGREGRRRKKTVSDVSGMFRAPDETNWSHV